MPKKNEQESTTSRFAHLLGFGKPNAKAEDEDEQKEKEMSEDEQKDEKTAEYDEDNKPEAEDENEKEEKAKKAGALAERARCAAIFSAKSASSRPDMAAHLAFETDMPTDEAVAMLDKIASGKNTQAQGSGLRQRMAEVTQPKIGASSPSQSEPKSFAEGLVAFAKNRGK